MQPKLYKLVKNVDLRGDNSQIIDADGVQIESTESKPQKQRDIIIACEVIED